jgi:hypothetical protein
MFQTMEFALPPWNGSLKWWAVNKVIGKTLSALRELFS